MGRFLYLSILLLAACSTVKKPQKTEGRDIKLESCSWTLRELNGVAVSVPQGGKSLFLDFSKGNNMLLGNGGCNAMNGMYTVHDDLIKLQVLSKTERTCSEDAMNMQETSFYKMMDETDRYKISSKHRDGVKKEYLELYKDKKKLALFEADSIVP